MRLEINGLSSKKSDSSDYAWIRLGVDGDAVELENARRVGFWLYVPEDNIQCWVQGHYMTDSNGCSDCSDPEVIGAQGIYPDQLELIEETTRKIKAEIGDKVPAFMAFHIPHAIFVEAEKAKGYVTPDRYNYIIGVDVEAKDGDYGFKLDSADAL